MKRTKAKAKRTKTKPKTRTLTAKWVLDVKSVVLYPPPEALEVCPRCGLGHKRIKPKKLLKPMEFFIKGKDGKPMLTHQASYWAVCPKTKEPIVLFDRYDFGSTVEKAVTDQAVKDICAEEDKKFLDGISTWTATYSTLPKGKKGKRAKTQITASFGPATTWVYNPNAPERIVPGTKKEQDAQRARVRAQEKAMKFAQTPPGEEKVTLASGPPLKAPKLKTKRR